MKISKKIRVISTTLLDWVRENRASFPSHWKVSKLRMSPKLTNNLTMKPTATDFFCSDNMVDLFLYLKTIVRRIILIRYLPRIFKPSKRI